MDREQEVLIEQVKDEAKAIFKGDYSGHDISHTMRVYSLALEIAKSEKADLFRVALTALLHDADDCKVTGKDDESLENAVGILGKIGLEENTKQKICEDIKNLSFRGSGKTVPASMEGKSYRMQTAWMPWALWGLRELLPMREIEICPSMTMQGMVAWIIRAGILRLDTFIRSY